MFVFSEWGENYGLHKTPKIIVGAKPLSEAASVNRQRLVQMLRPYLAAP